MTWGSILRLSWLWLLFISADVLVLLSMTSWVGEPSWSVDWANGGLYIASPALAAIAAALSYQAFSRSTKRILVGSGAAPTMRLILSVFARVCLTALLCHYLVALGALIATSMVATSGSVPIALLAYPVAPVVAFAAFGILVAAIVPNIFAVVISGLAAFWAIMLTGLGVLTTPALAGASTVSLFGLEPTLAPLIVFLGAGFAMAGAFLGVSAWHLQSPASALTTTRSIGSVSLIVGLMIVAPPMPDRFAVDAAPGFVCFEGSPEVCLGEGHTVRGDQVAAQVRESSASLRAAGIDYFDERRLSEALFADPKNASEIILTDGDLNTQRLTSSDLAVAFAPIECLTDEDTGAAYDDFVVRFGERLESGATRDDEDLAALFELLTQCAT